MSTDLSTPPQRRGWLRAWLWKTWFPLSGGYRKRASVLDSVLGLIGQLGAAVGRWRQRRQTQAPTLPRPTIAVGNVVMGGAGKTPACLGILEALSTQGLKAGLVSRGYGLCPPITPRTPPRVLLPHESASPEWIGDEPWLVHWRAAVPVAVHPNRHAAGLALLEQCPDLDVLILDDGLSQTSLKPQVRVLLLDERLIGNAHCLPAGPNRFAWPPSAPTQPDLVLVKGNPSEEALAHLLNALERRPICGPLPMKPKTWVGFNRHCTPDGLRDSILTTPASVVWAVAGIAEPHRFFQSVAAQGIPISRCIALDDHASRPWEALQRIRGQQDWPDFILTTEKDFGKLQARGALPVERVWALQLDHTLPAEWTTHLISRLQCGHGLKSA
ncbi:MAG: tetraacyldisaccharide 4'-kinase [Burkholderiaceae bacterium]